MNNVYIIYLAFKRLYYKQTYKQMENRIKNKGFFDGTFSQRRRENAPKSASRFSSPKTESVN